MAGQRESAARAFVAEFVWPMNKLSVQLAKALLAAARTLDEHPDGDAFYPYSGPVQSVHDDLVGALRDCRPTYSPLDELRAARDVRAAMHGEVVSRAELEARNERQLREYHERHWPGSTFVD